jgi:hypothetical protein
MMNVKYWEAEQPITVDTGKNVLRLFEKAGKLQVSMPYWTGADGETKNGKTVTLDIEAIESTPDAIGILQRIINSSAA